MPIERIIFVDDDKVNNSLSKIIVRQAIGSFETFTFEHAPEALEFIGKSIGESEKPKKTLLFVDINMPVMNGWVFLDKLAEMPDSVRNNLSVHLLSSSIDQRDRERAEKHELVESYISKPLPTGLLRDLVYPRETQSNNSKE